MLSSQENRSFHFAGSFDPLFATPSGDIMEKSSYIAQLHGSPIPDVIMKSNEHNTYLPRAHINNTTSMSKRRQACNRPTLNLHVNIPPPPASSSLSRLLYDTSGTYTPASGRASSTASPLPFPNFNRERGSNPVTPADQCIKEPLHPPEMPRMINVRRHIVGRWVPTPTEGVLPTLSSVTAEITPDCSPSSELSAEFDSSDIPRNILQGHSQQRRPRIPARAVSWLSYRKSNDSKDDEDALDSPFTVQPSNGGMATPPLLIRNEA